MKSEWFPYLSYLFAFKLAFLTNLGYAISALCYMVIFLKIRHSRDGEFRRRLLWYFGAAMLASLGMSFSHPLFNNWILPVTHIWVFIALIRLCWYILDEFWATKTP